MLYLSRLTMNQGRVASGWLSNPYRIHQRLKMACPEDPRLLFRVEEGDSATRILVQSHTLPDWAAAFNEFPVLKGLPEMKTFNPQLVSGQQYTFRLVANPTVRREGKRIAWFKEEDQIAWLTRHLAAAGAELLGCRVQQGRVQHSKKSGDNENGILHLLVQFDGLILCLDAEKLTTALGHGIGSAKGFGCGLLSLARAQ